MATPLSCQAIVGAMGPEYMTEGCRKPTKDSTPTRWERVLELARDVVAIGPGLGQASATRDFVIRLVDRATMPAGHRR